MWIVTGTLTLPPDDCRAGAISEAIDDYLSLWALPLLAIAIDRPASSVYASARRGLMLEAVSLGAALLAALPTPTPRTTPTPCPRRKLQHR